MTRTHSTVVLFVPSRNLWFWFILPIKKWTSSFLWNFFNPHSPPLSFSPHTNTHPHRMETLFCAFAENCTTFHAHAKWWERFSAEKHPTFSFCFCVKMVEQTCHNCFSKKTLLFLMNLKFSFEKIHYVLRLDFILFIAKSALTFMCHPIL